MLCKHKPNKAGEKRTVTDFKGSSVKGYINTVKNRLGCRFGGGGTITGIGALIEAGTISVLGVLSLINNLDDALGGFTNGDGSLSQDLTPDELKEVTTSIKSTTSLISVGVNTGQIIKNNDYDKAMKVLSTISDAVGAASNAKFKKNDRKK